MEGLEGNSGCYEEGEMDWGRGEGVGCKNKKHPLCIAYKVMIALRILDKILA